MRKRRTGEPAVEAEVHPVVHFVALAPPEETLGVFGDAGAVAEFDEAEEIVDVGARKKNGVGEIDGNGSGRVVVDDHVAAEERGAAAGVEEAGAASAGEAQDARDDVRWAGGNVSDDGAQSATRRPSGCRTGLGEVALTRLENHADLVHAGIDAACGGDGSSTGRSQATAARGERKVGGVGDSGDGKCSVVAGYTDAAGCHELTDDQAMRGCSLDRGRCGRRRAAAGSCEATRSGNVSELRAARHSDDRKCAVVRGDANAGDGYRLTGGKAVGGGGCDGHKKPVFGGAGRAGGDGYRGGLRCAARTGRDSGNYIFVDDRWAGSGSALADAIEIRVVILARQIVADFAVADGEILAAEDGGGISVGVRREAAGDAGEGAGRGFFVEHAIRVEHHGA